MCCNSHNILNDYNKSISYFWKLLILIQIVMSSSPKKFLSGYSDITVSDDFFFLFNYYELL